MSHADRPGSAGPGLPLVVDLGGRRVVVVGGGPVAQAKLDTIGRAGASPLVTVIAPAVTDELAARCAAGTLTWHERAYTDGDLHGAWLAVAATASPQVNAAVCAEAERRRVWCLRADAAESGTAALLATVRRGPLLLAVSTSGAAPALARALRRELGERYGPEYGELAALLGELRVDPQIRAVLADAGPDERRARWRALPLTDIVALVRQGRRQEAKEVAAACLCSSSD